MSYTVFIQENEAPVATTASNVLDALKLVRRYERESENIIISAQNGWVLTVDELEELAKN